MKNSFEWPEHLWRQTDVMNWILVALPDVTHVKGPTRILNAKLWGVTAEFEINGEPVIFKGCKLTLFSKRTATEALLSQCCPGRVPTLLAGNTLPNHETWTLYEAFGGEDVAQTKRFENLLKMPRALATIQATIAKQPPARKAALPQTPIEHLPRMLDTMIKLIENRYLQSWLADDAKLLNAFALPTNIVEEITRFRPQVAQWTQELLEGEWPISVDHVDFNITNAAVQEDGDLIIFDWEEAVISSPFFSLSRLLVDADDFEDDPTTLPKSEGQLLLTPNQMAVRDAYIDALPWHTRAQRGRAFDLAMCLAPIKTAYENEPFNDALGRTNGLPELAGQCFSQALHFWNAMSRT